MDVRVAIIGSGFGGLGAAIRLEQRGIDDFVILERAGDVGGTWRDNSYPGCACDVESHLYSFSFAQNPDWSWRFARQPEIQAYLQRCARDFGIEPHLRFHHEVRSLTWNEQQSRWHVETTQGAFTASLVILATGPLSEPVLPDVTPFQGKVFHSARWDHGYPLEGKRVAVIGTGASAIQFVPEIQPRVAKLHLFQRTPPWVIPRPDWRISTWRKRLYRIFPPLQRLSRAAIYAYREATFLLFRHPRWMQRAQRLAVRHIHKAITDPALRAKLTPDYTMGCKRVLLSNEYYPALAQPNVEVVTSGIRELRAHSIVGNDGIEREIDALILGTGFRPSDPPLAAVTRGRNGVTLAEAWQGSPRAHLGTTIAGFPNLFMLLGPNTGTGHNTVVYMAEAQIDHFLGALDYMERERIVALEPKAEAQAAYTGAVDARMRGTVWTAGGCASWYIDKTGRNSTLWPDFTWRYRRRVAAFDPDEYAFQ
jgi:cation diffusion facilitator CzcD-associated flavoprotein CzcO